MGEVDFALDVGTVQGTVHALDALVDGVGNLGFAALFFFGINGVQDEQIDGPLRRDLVLAEVVEGIQGTWDGRRCGCQGRGGASSAPVNDTRVTVWIVESIRPPDGKLTHLHKKAP